jgi:leader peptidase (prepilin peptidase)/N-methyltransferase
VIEVVAALVGAGVLLAWAVPAAGLTLTVPDRENLHWWRPGATSGRRRGALALVGITAGALAGWAAGWTVALPAWLALAMILSPLAIIDVEHHRLPDRLVVPGYLAGAVLLALAALIGHHPQQLGRAALALVAAAGVFAAIALIAPGAMGFGDVKLVGVLGGYLGWLSWAHLLAGVFLGFVIGAVSSLALMALRRANLGTAIAFGPSLMLGALVAAALG